MVLLFRIVDIKNDQTYQLQFHSVKQDSMHYRKYDNSVNNKKCLKWSLDEKLCVVPQKNR